MPPKTSVDDLELAKFAALSETWWDKDGDLKTLHDINPARVLFIKNYANIQGKSLLDVGCGGGILAEALAKEGAKVRAIDAEPQAIAAAKAHKADLAIDYSNSLIEEFESEPFDFITCMELLEHVKEPSLVLEHCERLLKPGGILFLSTINRSWAGYLSAILAAEYVLKLLPKQTHDYKKFIKPAELAGVVRKLGFEVIACKGLSYNPFSRQADLCDSVKVNYLMACRK